MTAPTVFVGRDDEFARLNGWLERAKAQRAQVVLLEGPGGMGKTTLVRHLIEHAAPLDVLAALADEAEADLPFGVVEQVLHDTAQLDTLRAATAPEPVAAGAAVLEALSSERHQPLLLLLEDVHWADLPSLQAISFALRRLRDEPILTLMTCRSEGVARLPDGLRRLIAGDAGAHVVLHGLNLHELLELAQAHDKALPRRDAERLLEHTGGNPLYAEALLSELAFGRLSHGVRGPLPAPSMFTAVILARLVGCSMDTERLVAAAAVIGERCRLGHAVRVAGLDSAFPAVDEAVKAELIEGAASAVEDEIRFPHPLVRSAIYHDLSPGRRAALHQSAAEVISDPRVSLHHLVAGTYGPDAAVAGAAEAWAREEMDRGAWLAAEAAFLNAARISVADDERQRRILSAIGCAIAAGDREDAAHLWAENPDLGSSALAKYIGGTLAAMELDWKKAAELLQEAWDRIDPSVEFELATRVATRLAANYMAAGMSDVAVDWSRQAMELGAGRPVAGEDPVTAHLSALVAVGRTTEGLALLEQHPDLVADLTDWPRGWLGRAVVKMNVDDVEGACADLNHVLDTTRLTGPASTWLLAASTLADAEYRCGRWDDSITHAELALSIAEDGQLVDIANVARAALAAPLASRGDRAAVDDLLGPILASGVGGMVLARAAYVLALLADAEDDAQGVVNALGHLVIGRGEPARGALSRHDLYTRALVRLGRLDEAHCHLAAMTAAANGQHANSVALAHSRAAIASASGDTDSANAAFDEAASLATATGGPFVAAQVGLDYGGFLRRRGRRRVAATRLEAARAGFESLGATTYVARCDRELGATGLGRRPSQPARATGLTPAEQAVANLIMQGASNRDAARTLVLSVRTIETHLGRIYRKLGVTSRAQLVGRIAGRDAGEVS